MLERELIAPRVQLQREAWPISAQAHWRSTQDAVFAPRVLHFSAFHYLSFSVCYGFENQGADYNGKQEEMKFVYTVHFL